MAMLKQSPDPLLILDAFIERFVPSSWSGSRAAIVESRLVLLDQLDDLKNSVLSSHASRVRPKLKEDIVQIRKWEDERDSRLDERFE
jgi:hypothetical protein